MYLCKTIGDKSLNDIGLRFDGRDHTTIIHALYKISRLAGMPLPITAHGRKAYELDRVIKNDIEKLTELICQKMRNDEAEREAAYMRFWLPERVRAEGSWPSARDGGWLR